MLRKKPDMDTHVAIWSACLPVSRRQQALSSVDLGILNCHWHRKTWTEPFCISAVSAHTFLSVHLKCQPQSTACVAVESKINMNPIWKEHQELKGSANMRLEPLYYIYIYILYYIYTADTSFRACWFSLAVLSRAQCKNAPVGDGSLNVSEGCSLLVSN